MSFLSDTLGRYTGEAGLSMPLPFIKAVSNPLFPVPTPVAQTPDDSNATLPFAPVVGSITSSSANSMLPGPKIVTPPATKSIFTTKNILIGAGVGAGIVLAISLTRKKRKSRK